ncbi:restriction endonuclease subunit S [Kitasatospora sp. DSM 101779]|uniref:restriction endonuclease subunit S n=1 Tax=Kitasatospora sp. DSM 101779 TaxID=2853165 RepID=UPI0021D7E2C1|nr:restriction endonuclease subunit S [Kitasatospora sp. DSM 101779]MCU7823229.1 restriction endonuclease subunit S [Kitasatospora sp. DSM 101779]
MTSVWTTLPLWHLVTESREVVEPSDLGEEVMHYSIPSVDATGTGQVEKAESIKSAKLKLRGGEVLISKLNPRKSRALIVESSTVPMVSSTEFVGLRVRDGVESRYLLYLLQSEFVRQELDSRVQSVTRSHQRVAPEEITHLQVAVPALEEQRRIVEFLDAETMRIGQLLAARQDVMEKLEERESALLDLEIDGLLATSAVAPLRRFVWSVDQGASPQCEAVPAGEDEWGVLKVSCLRPGSFFPGENKRLPSGVDPMVRSEVREGDLLITRANTPQLVGSTAVVPAVRSKLLLSDKIFRVRLTRGVLPGFVAELARGSRIRALCAASSNGASQSMANIRFEEVKAWPVPVVSIAEQRLVVERIASKRKVIEVLRRAIDSQRALLAERRQALITAAVTGQFDVSTASGRGVTE